jgi:hypothetical protein
MALIKCPECRKEVSSRAAACPFCGHPIAGTKDERSNGQLGRGCAGIIVLIGLVVGFSYLGGEKGEKGGGNPIISCTSDWHKCVDNADLVNHYLSNHSAQDSCKQEAESLAKYGTPKFPFLYYFDTFYKGDQYPKTGIAVLIEKDAQYSNGFGAMVHSTATCTYDLNQKKVVTVNITPN